MIAERAGCQTNVEHAKIIEERAIGIDQVAVAGGRVPANIQSLTAIIPRGIGQERHRIARSTIANGGGGIAQEHAVGENDGIVVGDDADIDGARGGHEETAASAGHDQTIVVGSSPTADIHARDVAENAAIDDVHLVAEAHESPAAARVVADGEFANIGDEGVH